MHRATTVAKCFHHIQSLHSGAGAVKHPQLVFYGDRVLRRCWRMGGTTANNRVPDRDAKFSDDDNVYAHVYGGHWRYQ
jgi:hypothetical protein